MTLHAAVREVLAAAGEPLTPRQVADEVNRRGLYQRADLRPIGSGQISARARNYPHLFDVADGKISLISTGSVAPELRCTACALAVKPRTIERMPTPRQAPSDVKHTLLEPTHFRSAKEVDADVPDQFGLYAIRARSLVVIPEPYRSVAEERESTLIYIGEATGQTLRKRFLRNELRGRGHGTFFRSIGAVLGYRPVAGSLVGKANQRNYRFSPTDTVAIVNWINDNLEVSWVAFDEGVHDVEVALIRRHGPLLNLRDNPRALRELSALRAQCCAIAQGVASEKDATIL
ncbi:GIY-YIG nuclease family protein [Microbacterium sp. Root166]|uniref:GIY-YIG nuclease family protein n=1 Tax=Microbacterium sp. Root166 TaxID=1736478 RepID=UPI0012F8A8C9|nr:hypothetical protein [Microbacterium sp. Root166]